MPISRIDSLEDPRLEPYRDLKRTNETRWNDEFIAEGATLVERMLELAWPTRSLLLADTHVDRFAHRIPPDIITYVLPARMIEQLIGFNFHRGALACGRRPNNPELADLVLPAEAPCLLVVCVDIHDPENVGSIIRSSAALGADGILLSDRCADPFSRRVLRTSMGGVFNLPIRVTDQIDQDLRWLGGDAKIDLVATLLDPTALPLANAASAPRLGIVVGNERRGLSQECQAACQRKVWIPMAPGSDSLNAAVAAGIVLHHFTRQYDSPGDRSAARR